MPPGGRQVVRAFSGAQLMSWDRFVIVDCAVDPELHPTLLHHAQQDGLRHRSLFDGQPEAQHAAAAPWLLELPLNHPAPHLHNWLVHLNQSRRACLSWLAADTSFDRLFGHLQAHLDVVLPHKSLALMRYFDPRAWLRYQSILSVDQKLALMGPILEWQVTLDSQPWTATRADLERLKQGTGRHDQTHA